MDNKMSKAKRAEDLGKMYAKHILEMDDEVKELKGAGFWNNFHQAFKKIASVATPIASILQPELAVPLTGLNALVQASGGKTQKKKLTRDQKLKMLFPHTYKNKGGGKTKTTKQKKVVKATDKRRRRGDMVKKIMKEKNLKFIEASKYIKENNIEY